MNGNFTEDVAFKRFSHRFLPGVFQQNGKGERAEKCPVFQLFSLNTFFDCVSKTYVSYVRFREENRKKKKKTTGRWETVLNIG